MALPNKRGNGKSWNQILIYKVQSQMIYWMRLFCCVFVLIFTNNNFYGWSQVPGMIKSARLFVSDELSNARMN